MSTVRDADSVLSGPQKAGTVKPAETAVARERLYKHGRC
jgi:hypothetical protein